MSADGVVRWVASQSANPALEALIREAERDKNARPDLSSPLFPAAPPRPLASSTSARPRPPPASASDEPEAVAFIELLKDVSRQLDENSKKKQRLARGKSNPLTKTSSTSSLGTARRVTRTASLLDVVSGKSNPSSLPNPNLNYDLRLTQPRVPAPADSPMQDVIDLTATDTELESPPSRSRMDVDDPDSDVAMNTSFFAEPPVRPKLQRPVAPPIQRARTGPPLLGMRRAPQLQSSQYSASQAPKTLTVPRFRPPLLPDTRATTSKKPVTTTGLRPPRAKTTRDADSSFDLSFEVDADTLEEVMKAYD